MIKTIILDFDGVVVESVDLKTEAFRESFQGYSDVVDSIVEYHLRNYNLSRFVKFKHIYEHFLEQSYDEDAEREIADKFSGIVFRKVLECPFVPGAEAFLEAFSRTLPLYLASGTPQAELERIVEKRNLRRYFRQVWGAPPETKVEFIRKALQVENSKSEEAIYVGDMLEDFRIAQATGVVFVGRQNSESFEGLDIPAFPNLIDIMEWIEERIDK